MDASNRRQYPRLEGNFRVDLLNMGDDPSISVFEAVIPGTALDVSRKGLRVKAHYNVPLGSLLSIVIYYKNTESICLSEVVWRREELGEYTYGLFFREWTKIDPQLEKDLATLEESADLKPVETPNFSSLPTPEAA